MFENLGSTLFWHVASQKHGVLKLPDVSLCAIDHRTCESKVMPLEFWNFLEPFHLLFVPTKDWNDSGFTENLLFSHFLYK